jgi:hypothetical protein
MRWPSPRRSQKGQPLLRKGLQKTSFKTGKSFFGPTLANSSPLWLARRQGLSHSGKNEKRVFAADGTEPLAHFEETKHSRSKFSRASRWSVSFRQGCAQQSGADVYHSFFDDWSSGVLGQGGSIVPGHPTAWLPDQISRVPLEFGQVLEGVHSTQFTGMDQTHEQIADLRPV